MFIKNISIKNFRNIKEINLDLNNNYNFFYGLNGQGKTSILESIYILSLIKSFRSNSDRLLINHNNDNYELIGLLSSDKNHVFQVRIYFSTSDGKNIFLNSERINKISNFIGEIPSIFLSLDSLSVINGDPSFRRKFLDILLCQTSPLYLKSLQLYKSALNQRNQLLNNIYARLDDRRSLLSWDEQIAKYGAEILLFRTRVVEYLSHKTNNFYKKLSKKNDEIEIQYNSNIEIENGLNSGSVKDYYLNKLIQNYDTDIERKFTKFGPHRDDLIILKNGYSFKDFASTGENKTLVLSLKFSEAEYLYANKKEKPLLLMDDIFGELDEVRTDSLLSLTIFWLKTGPSFHENIIYIHQRFPSQDH